MKTNFTQISNEILDNKELSLEQKGLLSILYRNAEDWKNYQSELITRSSCGRDKHARILKELALLGYIEKVTDGDLRDKSSGKFSKGETYWKLVKTTVDWNPVTGNQQRISSNWLPASNNTNVNNTNEIKQIKKSVSEEEFTKKYTEEISETDSDLNSLKVELNDDYIKFIEESDESYVKLLSNPVSETDSDFKVEKEMFNSYSNKKHESITPSTQKKKYFFRVNEKPDYHRLEEYFHSKGYSSSQALEMHKRLLSTDFKDASGNHIKYMDGYVDRELKNIKPNLSNEDIDLLIQTLSNHINLNLKQKDEDEYMKRYHSNKLECKEWIQKSISKLGLENTSKVVNYILEKDNTSTNIYQLREFLKAEKESTLKVG